MKEIKPEPRTRPAGPQAVGVPQDELLALIDAGMKAKGIRSDRSLCIKAEVGVDFIRDLRRRGGKVDAEKLVKINRVLQIGMPRLLAAVSQADPRIGVRAIQMEDVVVRGDVQAGMWREAMEWPPDDWYAISLPVDPRYPGVPRFGLEVRGASMDKLYPEGTILLAISFFDAERDPRTGDKVVVMRRDRGGRGEATIKEYELDAEGRHILWPRSTDPAFQTPIVLPNRNLQVAPIDGHPPSVAWNYSLPDAGSPELDIIGLVVGSYQNS